ncbi:MAG: DUF4340 domain-containing protein [Lewinellaceae bacterium]|nr:DUF4340 domain-containing protein [Lewinellaceae bacterium]
MNNKKLALVLVALVAVFLIGRLISGKGERNFDSNLVSVDTASVDKISMTGSHGTVILTRHGNGWNVSDGAGKEVPAVKNMAQGVLSNLLTIQSQRIITSSPDKWPDYEVTDTSGTHVVASHGGKTLADLIIGRFAFNQATRSGTSYIRKSGQDDVHAIDGFLSMNFSRDFDSFRDKSLATLTPADVKNLKLESRNDMRSVSIDKNAEGKWISDGMTLDSATVANYLSGLRFLNGTTFDDHFTPQGKDPVYTLDVSTNTQLEPLQITCFGGDGASPFVFHSSHNPDAYFASDSSQLYQTVIRSFLEMLPHDQ